MTAPARTSWSFSLYVLAAVLFLAGGVVNFVGVGGNTAIGWVMIVAAAAAAIACAVIWRGRTKPHSTVLRRPGQK